MLKKKIIVFFFSILILFISGNIGVFYRKGEAFYKSKVYDLNFIIIKYCLASILMYIYIRAFYNTYDIEKSSFKKVLINEVVRGIILILLLSSAIAFL
jgi:H+/gluconate symporter-like permease